FGGVPWGELFQPVIKLLKEGVPVSKPLGKVLADKEEDIRNSTTGLRPIFFSEEQDRVLRQGENYTNPQLVETFKTIADLGSEEFYTGNLSQLWLADIRAQGSIINETVRNGNGNRKVTAPEFNGD
ncbi:unnamed protein product, partial [Cyprideis torosa]